MCVDEHPVEGIDVGGFAAVVVHSDMERIGNFACGKVAISV